jgi:hypothetical protein
MPIGHRAAGIQDMVRSYERGPDPAGIGGPNEQLRMLVSSRRNGLMVAPGPVTDRKAPPFEGSLTELGKWRQSWPRLVTQSDEFEVKHVS